MWKETEKINFIFLKLHNLDINLHTKWTSEYIYGPSALTSLFLEEKLHTYLSRKL